MQLLTKSEQGSNIHIRQKILPQKLSWDKRSNFVMIKVSNWYKNHEHIYAQYWAPKYLKHTLVQLKREIGSNNNSGRLLESCFQQWIEYLDQNLTKKQQI
jgi:hypothetical protein